MHTYTTKQEIFDAVWNGAKAQGFERSVDAHGTCAYRGEDGRKCNAGHLIPDELYTPDLEGAAWCGSRMDHFRDKVCSFWEGEFLIQELQNAHDRTDNAAAHEARLRKVAQFHGLKIPGEG